MEHAEPDGKKPAIPQPTEADPDEVIPIKDLAPREDVKGGRKIVLGEIIGGDSHPKE